MASHVHGPRCRGEGRGEERGERRKEGNVYENAVHSVPIRYSVLAAFGFCSCLSSRVGSWCSRPPSFATCSVASPYIVKKMFGDIVYPYTSRFTEC